MLLSRKNFIDEVNNSPLKRETKTLLKYAVASYIDIAAGKESDNFLTACLPRVTLEEIKEFQNDMNNDATILCIITLDKHEMLHFIYENEKLILKPWTEEYIDLFEKAKTLSLTAHRAGSYHCDAKDYGHRHPAIYPSWREEQSRFLIYKTTNDRNGINLFVKDPKGYLANIGHQKEGEYTLINVNPNMNIFEYWPAIEPVRNPDGSRTVPW